MSKAQWDKPAWLAKEGPHTVRLDRRGSITTRPQHALDITFADLRERADIVREALHDVEEKKKKHGYSKVTWKQLLKRQRALEAELTALRRQQMNVYLPRYEAEFLRVARLMLDNETLQRIDNIIIDSIGTPPRHWNTFLAKKGYGWADRTMYDTVQPDKDAK